MKGQPLDLGRPFWVDSRSVSPVIGMILLVSIVIIALAALIGSGAFGMMEVESALEGDIVERELESIASSGHEVAYGGSAYSEVSISVTDELATGYTGHNASGSIEVDVDGSLVYQEELGAVTLEAERERFGYQGGGVWHIDSDGDVSVVVSPAISSVTHSDEPTYSLSLITVRGDSLLDTAIGIERLERDDIYAPRRVDGGDTITITIESKFAEGWEQALQNGFDLDGEHTSLSDTELVVEIPVDDTAFLHFNTAKVYLSNQP